MLVGIGVAAPRAEAAEAADELQVLFIGNSFTYFNDMPKMVAALAKAGKQRPLRFVQITPGGWTLENHWNDGKARAAIQSRRWDFVVLQEQSMGPLVNKSSMFISAKKLDAEIRRQGAKTLLYMTWAYQNRPEDQAALSQAYLDLAQEIDAEVVPVGLAWRRALQDDPQRKLHLPDKRHPNATGSYLAACVFYATLYDQSPAGLPGDIGKLTAAEALPLQVIAWQVAAEAEK